MVGWILKMLLKVMKPFVKIAIMEALMDYFMNSAAEGVPEEGTSELEPATGEDVTSGA